MVVCLTLPSEHSHNCSSIITILMGIINTIIKTIIIIITVSYNSLQLTKLGIFNIFLSVLYFTLKTCSLCTDFPH